MMRPQGWGENDKVIACKRVADSTWHYPEATEQTCELCGAAIWAGPPSVEQSRKPGWHLLCMDCLETLAKSEPIIIAGHTNRLTPYPWRAN
jgi:hypothetical protein